ncbi:MAG: HD-GYP domain-containing protein [Bacilli bacterium]
MDYSALAFIKVGQPLAFDLYNANDVLLLCKGTPITSENIKVIEKHHLRSLALYASKENISLSVLEPFYARTVDQVRECFEAIRTKRMNSEVYRKLRFAYDALLGVVLETPQCMQALYHLREHDDDTYQHSVQVGLIGALVAQVLHLPSDQVKKVAEMGLFHDLGKIFVPKDILNKNGALNEEEMEIMKQHTLFGYSLLHDGFQVDEAIAEAALLHHERLDGSGYPHHIAQNAIPFLVQLVSVADTYDAICANRSYRTRKTPLIAAQELMNEVFVRHFDPSIVMPFCKHIADQFLHARVKLSDGTVGRIVHYAAAEPLYPLVQLENSNYVDLSRERTISIVEILRPGA